MKGGGFIETRDRARTDPGIAGQTPCTRPPHEALRPATARHLPHPRLLHAEPPKTIPILPLHSRRPGTVTPFGKGFCLRRESRLCPATADTLARRDPHLYPDHPHAVLFARANILDQIIPRGVRNRGRTLIRRAVPERRIPPQSSRKAGGTTLSHPRACRFCRQEAEGGNQVIVPGQAGSSRVWLAFRWEYASAAPCARINEED